MAGDGDRQNFWTTVPGILTGIAAVLTAVTGLVIGLRSGTADTAREPSSQTTPAAPSGEASPAPSAGEGSGPAGSQSGTPAATAAAPEAASTPKPEPTVIITATDGAVTTVYARSFGHRQHGANLPLLSGQVIPFDRIKSVEVTRHLSGQADVTVTLINGTVHNGAMQEGLYPFGFYGENDLGTFGIGIANVARFSFER